MSRRPRRGRNRRRGRKNNWLWIGAIVASIVVAVGGMALMQFVFKPEEVDERLCPKISGPAEGLVIFLDITDPLNPIQHDRLTGLLEDRIKAAKQSTLIAVGAVRAGSEDRGADFALCKPLDEGNEIYQNPEMIEKRYRKEFLDPFNAIVSEMLSSPVANRSPIMESLQALLVTTPGFVDAEYLRRVIVVSDLLQHSDAFSFYRGDNWEGFMRSSNAERLAGRLRDAEVEICHIPRPGANVNRREVDDFWNRYFNRAGVSRVRTSTCPLGDL